MIEPTESRIFELDNKKYVIAGEIPIGGQARLFDVKTPQGEEAVLKLYVHDREMDSEKGFDRERIILEKAKKEERTDVPLILNSGRVDLGPLKVPAIVTKKIIGKTLEQVITRETNPTTEDVLILIKSVGNALKWAHAATKPIFHRDICPANIIFDEESENYKVMDWAAGRFGSGDTITNTQVYKSLYYTAPEVYNARKVMPAADIYSLSKTAMAYILGKDEFEGTFNGDPPIETFQRFNIPINLVNALFKAREEEPEKRYQSIDEFVKALNEETNLAVRDENKIEKYNGSAKYFGVGTGLVALISGLTGLFNHNPMEAAMLAGTALAGSMTSAVSVAYHFYEKRKIRKLKEIELEKQLVGTTEQKLFLDYPTPSYATENFDRRQLISPLGIKLELGLETPESRYWHVRISVDSRIIKELGASKRKHIYYTLKDIEAKLKSLGIEKFVTAYDLVRDKLFYKADCNLRYYYAFERNLGSNGKVSYLMSQVYDS